MIQRVAILCAALIALATGALAQATRPGMSPGFRPGFQFLTLTSQPVAGQRLATYGDILGSSLAAWLDASDNATVKNAAGNNSGSGEATATWIDKSVLSGARTGNPATATQATVARQPLYSTTALNNKPALIPSGSQFLAIPAMSQPAKYNATTGISAIAVVTRPSGTGAIFSGGNNSNDTGGPELRFDTNQVNVVNSYTSDIGRTAAAAAGPHIIGFDASSTGTTIWLDGVATTIAGNPAFTAPISQIFANVFGTDYFNGAVGEIVLSSTRLTADQSSKARGIAACKWNLQNLLPTNDNYRFSCPMVGAN